MDSFLLAHEPELEGAKHLFVDIGQRYVHKERAAARYVANSCGAEYIDMQATQIFRFEHAPTGIIPFRNAELILCAAQHGQSVYLGVIADEVNSDKSVEFLDAMKKVLDISHRGQYWTAGKEFELLTPFREISKTELVIRFLNRGGNINHLLASVSCYSETEDHCGKCSSCFKRWVALTGGTGTDYGHEFLIHPGVYKGRSHWAKKLEGYPKKRVWEVMNAFDIAGL
jgi:7-cyano-7-deazaguanine synthase in queuosine biosynthesis